MIVYCLLFGLAFGGLFTRETWRDFFFSFFSLRLSENVWGFFAADISRKSGLILSSDYEMCQLVHYGCIVVL